MANYDTIFVSNRTYKGAKNTMNDTMLPTDKNRTESISEGSRQQERINLKK